MVDWKQEKKSRTDLSESEIDDLVISQADDDAAWEDPIQVRPGHTGLALPAELAARAAFLARLHRAASLQEWLTQVIRERIEIEEVAFAEAKRDLAGKRSF